MPDWWRKKKYITNGRKTVRPTARAPYWRRIASTNVLGRYLIARIETAIEIIHWIALFLVPPNIEFCFMTVYVTSIIIVKRMSLAKRYSSKVLMSRMASLMNWIRMMIVSRRPSVNCWSPSIGPAVVSGEKAIVRNVMRALLFINGKGIGCL